MSNPQQRIISYYGASAVDDTTFTPSVGFTITDNTNILASNVIRQSIVPGLINQSIPDNLQVNTFIMSSYSTIVNGVIQPCIFEPNIIIEKNRFYHINANIIITTNEIINSNHFRNTYDYNLRGTIICDLSDIYIISCNLGFYGKNDNTSNQPSTYKSTIDDDILKNTTLKILGSQTPSNPALSKIDGEYPTSPQITLLFDSSFNYATTARAIANITITSGTLDTYISPQTN